MFSCYILHLINTSSRITECINQLVKYEKEGGVGGFAFTYIEGKGWGEGSNAHQGYIVHRPLTVGIYQQASGLGSRRWFCG